MKKLKILTMGAIMAILTTTGCAGGPGPAKSTLEPMKNVGPLVSIERRTVQDGTNTVKSTTIEKIESPEVGQLKLKLKELESRAATPSHRSKPAAYYWQTQGGFYGPPPPVYGGYGTGGSYYGGTPAGAYYGGTR